MLFRSVVACDSRPGEKCFDATRATAVTRRPGTFVLVGPDARPGKGIMAPFAGDSVRAGDQISLVDQAAPDAGAKNDAEDAVRPFARAVDGFRKREAVGVVRQAHRSSERGLEILVQLLAKQPDRIGVLDQAGRRRDRARNSDAHRTDGAKFTFDTGDKEPAL